MKTKQFATVILFSCVTLFASHEAQAFYNPSTGRWLSRDPIVEAGGVNLQAFASNDPCGHHDKLGLLTESEGCCVCYVHSSLKNGDGSKALTTLSENIDWLSRVGRKKFFDDFLLLGRRGGPLGTAYFLRAACGQRFKVNLSNNADDHQSQANWDSVAKTLNLNVAFSHYQWLPQSVLDFLGDYPESGAIQLGHELGHAFVELKDPFNVYQSENVLRKAFGVPSRPRYAYDYEDSPVKRGGMGLVWDNGNFGFPIEISGDSWLRRNRASRDSVVKFIMDWMVPSALCGNND